MGICMLVARLAFQPDRPYSQLLKYVGQPIKYVGQPINAVLKLVTLPAGFSALFGSASGLWCQGTYFSTMFGFATKYIYKLTGSAASQYMAYGSCDVCQVLVAGVLVTTRCF